MYISGNSIWKLHGKWMEESESKHRENSREVSRVRKSLGGGQDSALAINWARGGLNSNYGVSRENRSKFIDSRHT